MEPAMVGPVILLRRGTDGEFGSENPILADGEPAFSMPSMTLKVGDGTTAWNDLMGSKLGCDLAKVGNVIGVPVGLCTVFDPGGSYGPSSFRFQSAYQNWMDLKLTTEFATGEHSLSFALKADAIAGNQALFSRGSWTAETGWYMQLYEGNIEIIHGRDVVFRVSAAGSRGCWTHWIFTKTSDAPNLWVAYRNGVPITPALSTAGAPTSFTGNMYFGKYNDGGNYWISGLVSELRVFSKVLSAEEAALLYIGDEGVSGHVAWWRCDEVEGAVAVDYIASLEADLGGTLTEGFYSYGSPFTRPILPESYFDYVPCSGGIVSDPASPINGTVIPGMTVASDQVVWALKIKS